MQKWLLILCLTFFFNSGFSQSKVVARINNFENNKGVCLVCLYDNPKSFAGNGSPLKCLTTTISNFTSEAVFTDVAAGTYAVSVIHDANNNKKFDKNFLGIPKEGYGASQNKLPFAAAPKFDENKFTVSVAGTFNCTIRLRYLL